MTATLMRPEPMSRPTVVFLRPKSAMRFAGLGTRLADQGPERAPTGPEETSHNYYVGAPKLGPAPTTVSMDGPSTPRETCLHLRVAGRPGARRPDEPDGAEGTACHQDTNGGRLR